MKWRRWNNILHRDVAYFVAGMTLVYAISGIAVNHRADWNPSYKHEKEILSIAPVTSSSGDEILNDALTKLKIERKDLRNSFRPDPETLQLFLEEKTISIDLPTGQVIADAVHPRPVLFELNQLHLNAPKGTWTIISDIFAACLIFVAITGLFVLKGKEGLFGRGFWFVGAGIAVPVVYWLYYLYS